MVNLKEIDLKKVESAILDAENKTTGEIVIWIVHQTVPTKMLTGVLMVLFSILGGVFYFSCFKHFFMQWNEGGFLFREILYYVIFILCFSLVGYFVSKVEWIKEKSISLFYSKNYIRTRVRSHSFSVFMQAGLTETKERNGVLVLVSLLEHQVCVIADSGIYRKVEDGFWEQMAQSLSAGFSNKKPTDAFIEVIHSVCKKLVEFYPYHEGHGRNKNELSNRIRIGLEDSQDLY